MITYDMYKTMLNSKGNTLHKVRRNQSDMIMNATFTGDIGYKKVYILDKENGWHYEDAKYSRHAIPSILKDAVDYYLQFRPKIHYPVGTYLFIPNDEDFDIGFDVEEPEDPFKDDNFTVDKLWMIVGRDDANDFVRYNILKCNWNFRWVARVNGESKMLNVWGSVRNANSYTSGVWASDYSTQLDNIMNAWIPDTFLIYGDTLPEYNLCDTRYLRHEQRFMLTHNQLDPKVYAITKVQDLVPQGILKITLKQDELNDVKDNIDLMICDYYSDIGEVIVKQEDGNNPSAVGFLWSADVDENGVLQPNHEINHVLHIAQTSYYNCEFFLGNRLQDIQSEWRIEYIGNSDITDEEKEHLCNLLIMRQLDRSTISIRPSKANKLVGERFSLSVQDENGNYKVTIELEVQR